MAVSPPTCDPGEEESTLTRFRWRSNGNDLVAAYIRSGKHFPAPLADIVCKMADVGDRAQVYDQGQTAFTIGFVWQLVKALFTRSK